MEFVTHWIETNPEYSGLIVFLITFVETFAFVGALVPGVVVLFAAAALIGSSQSVALLPLVLTAAVATSISNTLSFYWGYALRNRIAHIHFFQKHQAVLDHSSEFFNRWGPLSIMVGRFVGPIRPFVAFAAGTLSFSPRRFLLFDTLAIMVWAPVYIVPGYLAGMTVDGMIPDWQEWPPLYLLSAVSTLVLIGFLAGNYWLQSHSPQAMKLARKLQVDELPLASVLLLAGTAAVIAGFPGSLPLDPLINSGFQQLLQPWGQVIATAIMLLSDPKLLLVQMSILILALVLLKHIRSAILMSVLCLMALYPELSHRPVTLVAASPLFSFTLLIGSTAALLAEARRPARRWFTYLIAIVILFITGTAFMVLSIFTLSQVAIAMLYGTAVTAAVRIAYSFLRVSHANIKGVQFPLIALLSLTTLSFMYATLTIY